MVKYVNKCGLSYIFVTSVAFAAIFYVLHNQRSILYMVLCNYPSQKRLAQKLCGVNAHGARNTVQHHSARNVRQIVKRPLLAFDKPL